MAGAPQSGAQVLAEKSQKENPGAGIAGGNPTLLWANSQHGFAREHLNLFLALDALRNKEVPFVVVASATDDQV